MQDPIPPSIFYGHTQRLLDTWEKVIIIKILETSRKFRFHRHYQW